MEKLEFYLEASIRENTQKSYASAIRHYEMDWHGFLPATADDIAKYLAYYAEHLSINTLRQRLAALSQWHLEQGFPDPTKTPLMKKLLKGIQAVHFSKEKQAKALGIEELKHLIQSIEQQILQVQQQGDFSNELRLKRNKSLILLGFWRGFRGDELLNLKIEHIQIIPNQGMLCYLPRSKNDRQFKGQTFKVPELPQLCPVKAYQDWIEVSQLQQGNIYRGISRWGDISAQTLHIDSLIPILRGALQNAQIKDAKQYTMHSLRRGFANWANQQGWDSKTLMQYVGWKNISSAIRYIDGESFDFSSIEKIENKTQQFEIVDNNIL